MFEVIVKKWQFYLIYEQANFIILLIKTEEHTD